MNVFNGLDKIIAMKNIQRRPNIGICEVPKEKLKLMEMKKSISRFIPQKYSRYKSRLLCMN